MHGDPTISVGALSDLGSMYYELGDLPKALDLLKRAAQINPTVATMISMASVQSEQGDRRSALENYHQALGMAMDIKERYFECEIRNGLGLLYIEMGRFREADEHLRQALLNAQERKAPNQEAMTLVNLGRLYEQTGDLPEAARSYRRAIKAYQKKQPP